MNKEEASSDFTNRIVPVAFDDVKVYYDVDAKKYYAVLYVNKQVVQLDENKQVVPAIE